MKLSDFLLAEVLPDGERHGREPGPGAGHVPHYAPAVLHGIVALDRVVISGKVESSVETTCTYL